MDSNTNSFSKEPNNHSPAHLIELKAVVDGEVVSIESIPDPVFSQKMIGDGYAIIPESSTIISPVKGKIVEVAEAKHAYYIEYNEKIKILIHIGENTLMLEGEGFTTNVENNDEIEVGQELGTFDIDLLNKEDYRNTISVIVLYNEAVSLEVTPHESKNAEAGVTKACDIYYKDK